MISIIIPAYNEEKRLPGSLQKLASFLETRKENFEVIVAVNASTDKTVEVAHDFDEKIKNLKVLSLPEKGKGWAIKKGMLEAQGEIALFTDADFSTPIEEIDKLLEKLDGFDIRKNAKSEAFDIAIGSRAIDRSMIKTHQNFLREVIGRTGNFLIQLVAVRGIKDTQCGFKAFKMSKSRVLFEKQRIFDFGFDIELLFLARKAKLSVAEVPVLWYNDAESKVDPVKDSIKTLLDLFKIRLYHSTLEGSIVDKLFFILYRYATFWRFSIVGVSNTIVDYGIFYLLTKSGIHPLLANPISVESAILWSFTWNSIWTFSDRKNPQPFIARIATFQFIQLGGLALSQISLLLLHIYVQIPELVAKAITIPAVLVFNYFLNSRWAFSERTKSKKSWLAYIVLVIALFIIYFWLIGPTQQ